MILIWEIVSDEYALNIVQEIINEKMRLQNSNSIA